MVKNLLFTILLLFLGLTGHAQAPVISSFAPVSGAVGATVTITGQNFNTTAAANVVFFGAVKANVVSASGTSLTVTVPQGASYGNLTVAANGLLALSPAAFVVTYPNGANMFQMGLSFIPQTEIPIGMPGNSVVNNVISVDFDGDGKPDLAAFDNIQVHIFKNTGSKTAPYNTTADTVISAFGGYEVVGDFNGDGKPDLALASYTNPGVVNVVKNTSTPGHIHFAPTLSFTTGSYPLGIAVGDFNGDGKLDIATNDDGSNSFSVLLNTTKNDTISFAPKVDFATGKLPFSIAVGDVDGDGKPDVVIANHGDYSVSVIRNTSTGNSLSFAAKVDYGIGTSPESIYLADIDGDGKADIITTNHLDFGNVNTGAVLRNTCTAGSLSFAAQVNYFTGVFSIGQVADMDGDGKPDLVLVDRTSNTGLLIQNQSTPGTIKLVGEKDFGAFYYPDGLAIGDFNGDGKPDIAVANVADPNTVSLLINQVNPLKPAINYFIPDSAAAGTTVKITGTNFTGATTVAFGNTPAASFVVNSATSISAVVGSGQSGSVTVNSPNGIDVEPQFTFIPKPYVTKVVITPSGNAYSVAITGAYFNKVTAVSFDGVPATSFTVGGSGYITALTNAATFSTITITGSGGTTVYNYYPPPTFTSMNVDSAGTGTAVTITGTNFTGATSVTFGGTAATSFTINSPTSITAIVGSGTSGYVIVTTPGGTAYQGGFVFITTPLISSFSPASAHSGAVVSLTGSNFTGATSVTFGGVPATSFKINSASNITAIVGNGASGSIVVTTPGRTASIAGFTYLPPNPVITSFSPTHGKLGDTITIQGSNFTNATAVSFGGTPAKAFTLTSPTTIIAYVDSGATGSVAVTNPGGSGSLPGFTYYLATTITSFSPAQAKTGDTVTITGTNFTGARYVTFGGRNASFTVVSPTVIKAVIQSGLSGYVDVYGAYDVVSSPGFTYLPPPLISSFSLTNATTVTITGNYFTGATAVSFGGVPAASFTVNSPTSITAKLGNGASGNISITTPYGTSSLAGFVYTFSLPADNFQVAISSATCKGSADGMVNITAAGSRHL